MMNKTPPWSTTLIGDVIVYVRGPMRVWQDNQTKRWTYKCQDCNLSEISPLKTAQQMRAAASLHAVSHAANHKEK